MDKYALGDQLCVKIIRLKTKIKAKNPIKKTTKKIIFSIIIICHILF